MIKLQYITTPRGPDCWRRLVFSGLANTLLGQLLHAGCGYFTSARAVFRCKGSPWRYSVVVALSWLLQWHALVNLLRAGLPRPQAVAFLMPLMALTAYGMQMRLVFR